MTDKIERGPKDGSRGPLASGNITISTRIYPENIDWYEGLDNKAKSINDAISYYRQSTSGETSQLP